MTTNLVQVDVVVTDADGKQVTDLRPEDFEVYEDGKKKHVTNFSYISTEVKSATRQLEPTSATSREKTLAPALIRPEQVGRTIALIVDDLGLSFESVGYVRQAVKKFVDEQMQPDDLVAIIRTSAGSGAAQQFTSDKRRLNAAVDRIQWYPAGRSGDSPFGGKETSPGSPDVKSSLQVMDEFEETRAANYSVGTLGSIGYVVRGLANFPGRKALILISESFKLFSVEGRNVRLLEAMRRLTDQANFASVAIYTLDASGLQTLTTTAADSVVTNGYVFKPQTLAQSGGMSLLPPPPPRVTTRVDQSVAMQVQRDSLDSFRKLNAIMDQRREQTLENQTVLSYLAQRTSGIFVNSRNDLGAGMERIMSDQKGYYLIGYRPDESTIDQKKGRHFHQLEVKVRRAGLRVRARTGYFGITDAEKRPQPQTRDEQIAAALSSPFVSDGVRLQLTALFGNDADGGSYIRALLQIDSHDLSFTNEQDGSHKTAFDVVAVSFGDDGRILDQLAQTQNFNVSANSYRQVLQDGLIYVLNIPVRQTGANQLRVAVRDAGRGTVGVASQFVEAPDLAKNYLALSGIIISGSAARASGQANEGSTAISSLSVESQASGPAVRRLRQGTILSYDYTIFNARVDPSTKQPQLQTQVRLYSDRKEVFTGRVLPYYVGQQTDLKRLNAGGRIRVGPELAPGYYILQVTVTDALEKNGNRMATQWADFEIVN